MLKGLKFAAGLLLLPACVAVSRCVWDLLVLDVRAQGEGSIRTWALPAGFLLWTALFFCFSRPFRTYVLGHELTHALWGLCLGARVSRMKVSRGGGWVELSKTNVLISLAPYFFPLYTVLVIQLYAVLGRFFEVQRWEGWWLGAVGFTWAFHLTFTGQMLASHQPDIQEHGRLFSGTVIYLFNLLGMTLWVTAVGAPTWAALTDLLAEHAVQSYAAAGLWIRQVGLFAAAQFQRWRGA
jgi:hypothetical protein